MLSAICFLYFIPFQPGLCRRVAVLLASLLLGIVGGAIPALGWMLFLSPYHYINTGLVLESAMLGAPAGVFPYALICLIFSLILGALACVRYYFKDFNV